jgi:hypothetical protein
MLRQASVPARGLRTAAAVALATVAAAGLDRLGAGAVRHGHSAPLPSTDVTALCAMSLAVLAFASRRWGLPLCALTALVLTGFDRRAGTVSAAVVAGLAIAEVALWSVWWPALLRMHSVGPADR